MQRLRLCFPSLFSPLMPLTQPLDHPSLPPVLSTDDSTLVKRAHAVFAVSTFWFVFMKYILFWDEFFSIFAFTCEKSVYIFGEAKFFEQSFLNTSKVTYHFISFFMSNDSDFWSRHISYLCWCWCERDLCLCCCCLTMLYSMLSGVSQWCLQMAGRPYHYRPPGM